MADWEWILDINVLGVVRGCKAFTPLFKQQGSGAFVNVASMAGLMLAPLMDSYNVSKAGVIALSETLSQRSEEHTSELQSRPHLVCRLLLEKKKKHHKHLM